MTDVRLIVGDKAYGSWKRISVTRTIEGIAGSFALTVSDQGESPIQREDPCKVTIGGETLVDGYIERRLARLDANTRDLTFTGYDKAQAIVANSVDLGRWTFRNMDLLRMAKELAEPFGV